MLVGVLRGVDEHRLLLGLQLLQLLLTPAAAGAQGAAQGGCLRERERRARALLRFVRSGGVGLLTRTLGREGCDGAIDRTGAGRGGDGDGEAGVGLLCGCALQLLRAVAELPEGARQLRKTLDLAARRGHPRPSWARVLGVAHSVEAAATSGGSRALPQLEPSSRE